MHHRVVKIAGAQATTNWAVSIEAIEHATPSFDAERRAAILDAVKKLTVADLTDVIVALEFWVPQSAANVDTGSRRRPPRTGTSEKNRRLRPRDSRGGRRKDLEYMQRKRRICDPVVCSQTILDRCFINS